VVLLITLNLVVLVAREHEVLVDAPELVGQLDRMDGASIHSLNRIQADERCGQIQQLKELHAEIPEHKLKGRDNAVVQEHRGVG